MKFREILDTAKASMAASHKVVVKDEPECDALNEGFALGVAYAADKFKTLEDAEVYGLDTGKVSVVTAKPYREALGIFRCDEWGDKEKLDAVLSVVLGDVVTAEAVGTVSVERVGNEGLSQAFLIGGGGTLVHDLHGECVALLGEKK